jgi:hypothetical protein
VTRGVAVARRRAARRVALALRQTIIPNRSGIGVGVSIRTRL